MFTAEEYIRANKNAIIHNCIVFYLWYNRSFQNTLNITMQNEEEYHCCDWRDMYNAILTTLNEMTTERGVIKHLKSEKEKFVCPFYRTINKYIEGEIGKGITIKNIVDIINEQLSQLNKITK